MKQGSSFFFYLLILIENMCISVLFLFFISILLVNEGSVRAEFFGNKDIIHFISFHFNMKTVNLY